MEVAPLVAVVEGEAPLGQDLDDAGRLGVGESPGRLVFGTLFLGLALFLMPALFGRLPQSQVWSRLIVGLLLIGFVIVAPRGIVGLVQEFMRERASDGGQPTWRSRLATFANMRPGAR